MGSVESKRCRNIRRVLIALFIVCGYMLSTTFASAYFDIDGKETSVSMTALNLALGSMGGDTPMYQNKLVGGMYIVIPFIGFFFMFFDKKSNVKNLVGMICGIVGCLAIAFPLGANGNLYIGIGAVVSMIVYVIITMLSGISIFMNLENRHSERSSGRRLSAHGDEA